MTHPMLSWLEAQLAEDEESAREGHVFSWHTRYCGNQPGSAMFGDCDCECDVPAAVLADIASKRAILAIHSDGGSSQGYTETGYGYIDHCCETCGAFGEFGHPWPCETVRALVSAFAGRRGYLEDWAPSASGEERS